MNGFSSITHLQDVFILVLSVQLPGSGEQTWRRDGRRETWAIFLGNVQGLYQSLDQNLLVFGEQEHEGDMELWRERRARVAGEVTAEMMTAH